MVLVPVGCSPSIATMHYARAGSLPGQAPRRAAGEGPDTRIGTRGEREVSSSIRRRCWPLMATASASCRVATACTRGMHVWSGASGRGHHISCSHGATDSEREARQGSCTRGHVAHVWRRYACDGMDAAGRGEVRSVSGPPSHSHRSLLADNRFPTPPSHLHPSPRTQRTRRHAGIDR